MKRLREIEVRQPSAADDDPKPAPRLPQLQKPVVVPLAIRTAFAMCADGSSSSSSTEPRRVVLARSYIAQLAPKSTLSPFQFAALKAASDVIARYEKRKAEGHALTAPNPAAGAER